VSRLKIAVSPFRSNRSRISREERVVSRIRSELCSRREGKRHDTLASSRENAIYSFATPVGELVRSIAMIQTF